MAQFKMELPDQLMKDFKFIYEDSHEIFAEMVSAGADVVYNNVLMNMRRSFKDSEKLAPFLKKTKVYDTYGKTVINCKVAFYGYYKPEKKVTIKVNRKATESFQYKTGRNHKATRTGGRKETRYSYESDGVPVPLIIIAREYGTSSGERKKPFYRKSWKKDQIESAMLKEKKKASRGLLE